MAIPHSHTLQGHSDADVALHALTDAILGAIGEGDIGTHFPPTDMQWKNAASSIFLKKAVDLLQARGGILANVELGPDGKPRVHGIFAAIPYCLDLIGGPYLETNDEVCQAFRPKSAIRAAGK